MYQHARPLNTKILGHIYNIANIFRDLLIKHQINLFLWVKWGREAPFQSDLRLEEA